MQLRKATPQDVDILLDFIKELAIYEKMLDDVKATKEDLLKYLFNQKYAQVLFILENNKEVGFGLYFYNFSTFVGRPGIYLEDLYIKPEYRKKGYGKQFFKYLINHAKEEGFGRIEWSCLNWNQPSIDFYLSLKAKPMDQWTVYRLDQKTIMEYKE